MNSYKQALSTFYANCKLKNLSSNTIYYYSKRLEPMVEEFEAQGLTPGSTNTQHIRDYMSSLIGTMSNTTVNHFVCAAKAFFSYLLEEGFIDRSPMTRVKKLRLTKRVIQSFSPEQVKAILAIPDRKRFSGLRDYTIMLVMLDTGARIGEVVGMKMGDIDWADNTLLILGKGAKERRVPFGQKVRRALVTYLQRRGELNHDYVFATEYGDGPLSRNQVLKNVWKYGKDAGVTGVRVSPHTFRHTAAVNWIRNGGDVFTLQRLLGHSSLEMVRNYVNLASTDLQSAHRSFSPADRMLNTDRTTTGRKKLR